MAIRRRGTAGGKPTGALSISDRLARGQPMTNATCSVSAKKLSTTRSRTRRPTRRTGSSSSGMILVGSSTLKANWSAKSSSNSCRPSSHSGKSPWVMASHRSRRWKSGSAPLILTASSHTTDCGPRFGFQWNVTNVDRPSALTSRNVCTPKPSMNRKDRGWPGRTWSTAACGWTPASANEVPEVVVRGPGLREAAVGLLLGRVDQVGELDRVLDEEDRDVVPDEVPVALPGVELGSEAAHVAGQVGGSRKPPSAR